MNLLFLFLLVMIVCFGFLLLFTRPSQTTVAIQRRMSTLESEGRQDTSEGTILKQDKLSPSPAIDDLLYRIPGTLALLDIIKQSGTEWWVSSLIFGSVLCGFGGALFASLRFESGATVVLLGVIAACLPTAYLFLLRQRRLQACDTQLPQAIELMSRALRAGHALNASIELVSRDVPQPLGNEFRMVYEEQALGLPLRDALMNLLHRIPRDDMRFLATALLLQKETGGNLVQILDTTARVMRERTRLRNQIKIYTAQARLTAWVVSLLPFLMFLLLNILNPGYEKIMLDDPTGRSVVYFGLVMWAVGIYTVRRLVQVKT